MEFESFQKIPRLNREVIITEKIDGSNAQVFILDKENWAMAETNGKYPTGGLIETEKHYMLAGSRNRWLAPGKDNFGFWAWVYQNRDELVKLGLGRHFGEWWGQGIQRTYGLDHKRFSLFNTSVHGPRQAEGQHPFSTVPELGVVPVLYRGSMFDEDAQHWAPVAALKGLKDLGSIAAPGFMDPEGIIIYHSAGNCLFKATLEDDEKGKGQFVITRPSKDR